MCVFNVFVIVQIVTNRANISCGEVNSALRWSSGKEHIFISGTFSLLVAQVFFFWGSSVVYPILSQCTGTLGTSSQACHWRKNVSPETFFSLHYDWICFLMTMMVTYNRICHFNWDHCCDFSTPLNMAIVFFLMNFGKKMSQKSTFWWQTKYWIVNAG